MDSPASTVKLGRNVYLAPTAYVGGDVEIGDQCAVMHQAVIRGDISAIRIGRRVNVQDGAILHTDAGGPLHIGDEVAIGHRAVVHCNSVGSGSLIGIGAIVCDGCEIGPGCIVAPGALVPPNARIEPNSILMGVPARLVRYATDEDFARIKFAVDTYIQLGTRHKSGEFPNVVRASTA